MKHVRDMSHNELLAAMQPKVRQTFSNLSPAMQERFIAKVAAAQDKLHEEAVWSSWFNQGLFYE